jgi:hypothetical protein
LQATRNLAAKLLPCQTKESGVAENELFKSIFRELQTWTLEYDEVKMQDASDYAKTVTTSGGKI